MDLSKNASVYFQEGRKNETGITIETGGNRDPNKVYLSRVYLNRDEAITLARLIRMKYGS